MGFELKVRRVMCYYTPSGNSRATVSPAFGLVGECNKKLNDLPSSYHNCQSLSSSRRGGVVVFLVVRFVWRPDIGAVLLCASCVCRMRQLAVLAAVVALAAAGPRERRQAGPNDYASCRSGNGVCVPYYLCNDGSVITDGSGIIDIR